MKNKTRYFIIDNTPEVGRVNTFLCHVSQGKGYIHFFNVDIEPCPIIVPKIKTYNTSLFLVKLFITKEEWQSSNGVSYIIIDRIDKPREIKKGYSEEAYYKYYADISTLEVIPIEIDKRLPSNLVKCSLENTGFWAEGGSDAENKLHKAIYKCLELKLDISDCCKEVDEEFFNENIKNRYTFNATSHQIDKEIDNLNKQNYEEAYKKLIKIIKVYKLNYKDYALELYKLFCKLLTIKYGPVDRDYDDNPTKRGKEWLDIHHILEYQLDDIARRTQNAQDLLKIKEYDKKYDRYNFVLYKDEYNDENIKKIEEKYSQKNISIYRLDYTLEELKPYNVKEQLVYANQIEHFLLHYLIDSFRGQDVLSGGPNFLWDSCVALDLYGFYQPYLEELKEKKSEFYSILNTYEITKLYKKLINWKNWNINELTRFWTNFNYTYRYIRRDDVTNISDKPKFFEIMHMLGISFSQEIKEKIETLPYLYKVSDGKIYKGDYTLALDGETLLHYFGRNIDIKTLSIPTYVKHIKNNAFNCMFKLESITIPNSIESMDDGVFANIIRWQEKYKILFKRIIYKGTEEEWTRKFSNVDLCGIKLICKK